LGNETHHRKVGPLIQEAEKRGEKRKKLGLLSRYRKECCQGADCEGEKKESITVTKTV